MTETQLVNAGLKFLALCDPNDGGFWGTKVAFADDLPGSNDINNKVLLTAPAQIVPGQPEPLKHKAYFRTSQSFERSLFEPIRRFLSLASGIHLQLTPKDPNTGLPGPPLWEQGWIAASMANDSGPFSIAYSVNATQHPQFLLPNPQTTIEFRAIIDLSRLALPLFLPMPPRKPRKWGRVLTPKWEAEHAQIVAQRKFRRNAKKAKEGKLDRFEGYPTLKAQCDVKTVEAHLQTRAALLRRMDSLTKRTKNGNRRATLRNARRALAKLVKGVKRVKRKT